jgi:hypothetical protein
LVASTATQIDDVLVGPNSQPLANVAEGFFAIVTEATVLFGIPISH